MTLAVSEPVEAAQTRAAKSSFYLAMRLMPRAQRSAMFEIYSFCRAVDDIADDAAPVTSRRRGSPAGAPIWRRFTPEPRRRA